MMETNESDFVFSREMLREADEALIDEEVARFVAEAQASGIKEPHVVVYGWARDAHPSIVPKLNAAGINVVVLGLHGSADHESSPSSPS